MTQRATRVQDAAGGARGAGRERSACYNFCGDSLFTECVERGSSTKDPRGKYRLPKFQGRAVVLSTSFAPGKEDDIAYRDYGKDETALRASSATVFHVSSAKAPQTTELNSAHRSHRRMSEDGLDAGSSLDSSIPTRFLPSSTPTRHSSDPTHIPSAAVQRRRYISPIKGLNSETNSPRCCDVQPPECGVEPSSPPRPIIGETECIHSVSPRASFKVPADLSAPPKMSNAKNAKSGSDGGAGRVGGGSQIQMVDERKHDYPSPDRKAEMANDVRRGVAFAALIRADEVSQRERLVPPDFLLASCGSNAVD